MTNVSEQSEQEQGEKELDDLLLLNSAGVPHARINDDSDSELEGALAEVFETSKRQIREWKKQGAIKYSVRGFGTYMVVRCGKRAGVITKSKRTTQADKDGDAESRAYAEKELDIIHRALKKAILSGVFLHEGDIPFDYTDEDFLLMARSYPNDMLFFDQKFAQSIWKKDWKRHIKRMAVLSDEGRIDYVAGFLND